MLTVKTRMTRPQLHRLFRRAAALCAGRGSDPSGIVEALLTRVGLQALSFIREAFIAKARGGTDAAGDSWPKLSPKTIAYSRRHPGMPSRQKRSDPASRPSAILNQKFRDKWWQLYRIGLAKFDGDKGHAAAIAWIQLKAMGAPTIIGTYGNTQVEILRDTGLLLASLTPGVQSSDQVFKIGRGQVILGTNRKWAGAHHHGIPGRLLQRRLWPKPERWPAQWWMAMQKQLREGLIDLVVYLAR